MSADPTNDPRYTRQRRLPFWDSTAQSRLASAHAMIVGVGALGCPCADLLVRAGVGRVTLIDRDLVDVTNLHRQTLYTDEDAKAQHPKALAAAARLAAVNPAVQINPVVADFGSHDAEHLVLHEKFGEPNVLIDGVDNFETRFIINDLSVKHAIPYVYGGTVGTKGMAAVFRPGADGPCLRCVFSEPPPAGSQPTCETAGVFSPVSSIVASYQAGEAMKLLMGHGERAMGSLLSFDLWEGRRSRVELGESRDPDCPCCGRREFVFLERDDEETVSICGKDAVQVNPSRRERIDLASLRDRLNTHGRFEHRGVLVKGRLDEGDYTLSVFHDGRAIIEGTDDPALARSLYSRYIGI